MSERRRAGRAERPTANGAFGGVGKFVFDKAEHDATLAHGSLAQEDELGLDDLTACHGWVKWK